MSIYDGIWTGDNTKAVPDADPASPTTAYTRWKAKLAADPSKYKQQGAMHKWKMALKANGKYANM